MPRHHANLSPCSAAQALELLGDRWTLLLIREVAFGTRRFDEFAAHLGIARNVLTSRLNDMIASGLLQQAPVREDALRMGYHLTEKGRDLLPILVALLQWGDRWLQTPESIPLLLIERASGEALEPMRPRNRSGVALELRDLDWVAGPGSTDPRIAVLVAAYEKQRRVAPRPAGLAKKIVKEDAK